jgi:hypothetical protein
MMLGTHSAIRLAIDALGLLLQGNRSSTPLSHCAPLVWPRQWANGVGATRWRQETSKETDGDVGGLMSNSERRGQQANGSEREQEAKNIRRLQIMISMVMSVIGQDPNLTVEEASELAAGAKRAALAMFPDKEFTYDILYKPRLQRLMNERFRLQ